MLTLTVARARPTIWGWRRSGTNSYFRFTRLSEAESDVKFHPSVLTKNKLLVHTSRGSYLWAHIQITPSVLHGSLRPRAECHARLAHILESLNKLATHALELMLDARRRG